MSGSQPRHNQLCPAECSAEESGEWSGEHIVTIMSSDARPHRAMSVPPCLCIQETEGSQLGGRVVMSE